jgi:hypothetical protein
LVSAELRDRYVLCSSSLYSGPALSLPHRC